ncbi:MAG: UDP-3-O-(3-hydroxymyristoyl)glucosamine N-acyltransferase [Dysgonamonadaceae bacterium]|jgi:UDP-3-O-[3-hydroxymyristoyl] glucosamine N-acyltransferase|nr:UDP-3-O-(3-hydroxymyristoyl)glucosamine N-acyltransferase [Dysgonamonadaceae bacterium]MDD3727445.1 UDP-3-O-(3-hydroxymyristoyl)glucosamine N-acyltransferase [Dysgonamonadaceae bacterium]MDD4246999.1 UDP-3-O-(3-hydroxymyristoyl)glucosamine N-acyltransferase [Dysgonamonadaceae bacterium]MDD4604969.1 UDP-3-O-(3-hydroxymyristoyl)glucosamine N-acyltransferase [Dysgonamonadaceae bacterium]HUI32988.1 UDP-3-O-(3-hydroxymyristoyl)glucosamine N-acyltransferase [Dysgonamonadaceae bacterium]
MEFSAKQIADFLKGEIVGNPDVIVNNFAKIEEGTPKTLTFLSNPKYTPYIYKTKSDIVLVNNSFRPEKKIGATLIRVPDAYEAFAQLLELVEKTKAQKRGVETMSYIASSAKIGENIYLGAFAYISEKSIVGDNCKIYPHVFIDENVIIGNKVTLFSGVKIYAGCKIGDNVIIHSNAVIGSDGFGFAPQEDGSYHKIPQLGNVVIEKDVEIGANTTIDRAVMGSTIIHEGVKLDNLIQIAHNVEIGKHTVMASQTGISGSTKIGEKCVFGGQVGLAGHLKIGDNVKLGAQSGIMSNIKDGAEIIGSPAIPIKNFYKSSVIFRKLPELDKQISQLEKELERLKNKNL